MPTKYQHVIPASYLGQFAHLIKSTRRESLVCYYDLKKDKILQRRAEKILGENWYFEINYDFFDVFKNTNLTKNDFINTVENRISDIENKFADLCNKKSTPGGSWDGASTEELAIVVQYAIHLHMRTKRKRREISEIWKTELNKKYHNNPKAIYAHKESLLKQGIDPTKMDKYLTEEGINVVSNLLASKSVLGYKTDDVFYKKVFDKFMEYKFKFVVFSNTENLITSDSPVIIGNRCILFPVNKNVCLVGIKEVLQLSIDRINSAIASSADDYIVGSSEDLIEKYKVDMLIPCFALLSYLDEEMSIKSIYKILKAILGYLIIYLREKFLWFLKNKLQGI